MKKVISISLAIVFVLLTFAGCSSNPSKKKLLSEATEVTVGEINEMAVDNIAKAKETYCNKALKIESTVIEIKENSILLGGNGTYRMEAYISTDELVTLQEGQTVVVVGLTSDEVKDYSEPVAGVSFPRYAFQMPTAYLVEQ